MEGEVLKGATPQELGIYLPSGATGNVNIKCPACAHSKTKNHNQKHATFHVEKGIGRCHRCNAKFITKTGDAVVISKKQEYTRPERTVVKGLNEEHKQWFMTHRGLTTHVLQKAKICTSNKLRDAVAFPYFKDGVLVNVKHRTVKDKKHAQEGNAEHVVFNYDLAKEAIAKKPKTPIVINEGEFDSLSCMVAGYTAVSVDQGAPNESDKTVDKKLACIDNSFDLFDNAEKIIVCVDSDANGVRLEKELIRRFEQGKVFIAKLGDYKDANEALLREGKDWLASRLASAELHTPDGIYHSGDARMEMVANYRNGKSKGTTTHYDEIDPYWTWRTGEVSLVTGYANEGKTVFFNNLALIKSIFDEWKFGVFSPENMPISEYFEDMVHTLVGKSSDMDAYNRMSEEELTTAIEFIQDKFYLIYPEEDFTIDTLLKKFKFLVMSRGIKAIVIDPYNQVHHRMEPGEREDLYISRFMSKLKKFAVEYDVAVFLIAHQVTPKVNKETGDFDSPNLYSIKGGGTFADKCDNVLAVWRPHRVSDPKNPLVNFSSQKIKKQKLTGVLGSCELYYDWKSNRYNTQSGDNPLKKVVLLDDSTFDEGTGEVFNEQKYSSGMMAGSGVAEFETCQTHPDEEEPPF